MSVPVIGKFKVAEGAVTVAVLGIVGAPVCNAPGPAISSLGRPLII